MIMGGGGTPCTRSVPHECVLSTPPPPSICTFTIEWEIILSNMLKLVGNMCPLHVVIWFLVILQS